MMVFLNQVCDCASRGPSICKLSMGLLSLSMCNPDWPSWRWSCWIKHVQVKRLSMVSLDRACASFGWSCWNFLTKLMIVFINQVSDCASPSSLGWSPWREPVQAEDGSLSLSRCIASQVWFPREDGISRSRMCKPRIEDVKHGLLGSRM